MPCPYCLSCVKGVHRLCCKEMRALERIDIIVGDSRNFNHTKALLAAIFAKQDAQRKGRK